MAEPVHSKHIWRNALLLTRYMPQSPSLESVSHGDWILVPSATALKLQFLLRIKVDSSWPFDLYMCLKRKRKIKTPKLVICSRFTFIRWLPSRHTIHIHIRRLLRHPLWHGKGAAGPSTVRCTSVWWLCCQRQNWAILAVVSYQLLRETSN